MTLHIMARVGAERFAFPAAAVEQALDAPSIEWVPSAPAGMLGQLAHRGRMISAWDAGQLFHIAAARGGAALVLRDGTRRRALVVDDVTEMARVEPADMRGAPAGSDPDGVLAGVFLQAAEGTGGALVNVVDVDVLAALMTQRGILVDGVAP
jgi:chemotaxis signal transduction protein